MLLKIREKSRGIVAYFIVGLIAIAFSLWGMDSLFTAWRGDPNEAVQVNGETITHQQIDRRVQQQMRQLLQSGQIDPDQLDTDLLRQIVTSQLVQQELLRQETERLKLRVSDRQVEREMVRIDAFRGQDGRFNQETFTQLLRQEGLSPAAFRAQLREDILVQQLLSGLYASEFVTPAELAEFQRIAGEKRDYRYLLIRQADFMDEVNLSEADIEAFYTENARAFMAPRRVQLDYLMFDPDSLMQDMSVSEEEIQQEYQRYIAGLEQQGRYRAAHILLSYDSAAEQAEAQAQLEGVREEVLQGADFAELAADLSEDTATARRGGDLGWIEPGSLDPAFESALFALTEAGQVSPVVATDFGLHLIYLADKQAADIPALDEVRDGMRERLLAQPMREAVSEKLELLRNLSFSADRLDEVAQQTGLERAQTDWLYDGQLPGFWRQDRVRQAIFSQEVLEDGWVSEPVRLEDGRYVLIQKAAFEPAQQRPLAEVRDEVIEELTFFEAQRLAEAAVLDLQTRLVEGESLEHQSWVLREGVSRTNRSDDRQILSAAFALTEQAQPAVRLVNLPSGDVALVQLLSMTEGEVSSDPEELTELRQMLQGDKGYRLQTQFVHHLEQQAEIKVRN